jgi:hypothetical protein
MKNKSTTSWIYLQKRATCQEFGIGHKRGIWIAVS